MLTGMKTIRRRVSAGVIIAAGLLLAAQAALADTLILKDGRELEGTIVRETDTAVLFKVTAGKINSEQWYARSDIEKLVESDDTGEEGRDKNGKKLGQDEPEALPENATPITFLTLGDGKTGRGMVGTYMSAAALKRSVEALRELPEEQRPDVLVLEIESGGGLGLEVWKLADLIHNNLKKDFRVVAWIESAISAAAMTAFACDEIIMTPQGNLGGAVGYVGGGQSIRGERLLASLEEMEKISKMGRRSPYVMKAMQMPFDLSADKDELGNVTFYPNLQGEYILCTEDDTPGVDHVLTLNSEEATFFNIAHGVAGSKEAVAEALGLREWVEVGAVAEETMQDYLADMKENETKLGLRFREYGRVVNLAQNANNRDDLRFYVGKAEFRLNRIENMVEESPPLRLLRGLNEEWFEQQRDLLRELRDRAN